MDSKMIPDSQITTDSPGVSSFSQTDARLITGSTTPISNFLQIQLNTISLITGFAVRATGCSPLRLKYHNVSGGNVDYKENNEVKVITRFIVDLSISVISKCISFVDEPRLKSLKNTQKLRGT
jgi:hypothetical protein